MSARCLRNAGPALEVGMREIGMAEIIAICGVVVLFGFALILLVGALRRKQARLVQRTLIDKLATGNELAAFLQTPAGDRFLRAIADPCLQHDPSSLQYNAESWFSSQASGY